MSVERQTVGPEAVNLAGLAVRQVDMTRSAPRRPLPDDDLLILEPPRIRIAPGVYEARSTAVSRRCYQARAYLEALFDIFEGPIMDGVLVARGIPGFFNMPKDGRRVGRSSKLGRWIQLLDPTARQDRVPVKTLKDKYWRVRVVDVALDGQQQALPVGNRYSKVAAVLERLA